MGFHSGGWFSMLTASDSKPHLTWALLRRVLVYGYAYRWRTASLLALILLNSALTLASPLIFRDMIDRAIPTKDMQRVIWLGVGLLSLPLIGGGLNVIQRRLNASIGEGVIFDLRVTLFTHLQRMSLRFFTNTKVGELMSRLNSDVVGAQNAVSNTLVSIITNLVQGSVVALVMFSLEWRLTLLSVVILPLFLVTARLMGARLREITRQQMDTNAQMNAMMNETLNISGALLVKLFGRQMVEVERFTQRASKVRDLGVRRAVLGASFFVIIGLISAIGTALIYTLGGYLVIQGAFTIGTIVAFGSYLGSLYGALQGLANAPAEFATSMVSFERVFEVLDLPLDVEEKPDAQALSQARGALHFQDVTFHYGVNEKNMLSEVERHGHMANITAVLSGNAPKALSGGTLKALSGSAPKASSETAPNDDSSTSQARPQALENISFEVQPGQLVALVGPSGAGKTTLTYLIPRLYDPSSGSILLDGHDLRDLTLESLSAQIGMVTQETHLFHDTIRTNLLYARLDATQAELEAACKAANIHNFISGLPDGYDTIVGERGYRLSGGEKQRLALARVILKDPRILVLDEATSHLDSESEALIQDALKRVMAGRTSIVIAHRLSTILAADQILVMNRGQIVERGTHGQLLALGGLYASLYQTQFRSDTAQPDPALSAA